LESIARRLSAYVIGLLVLIILSLSQLPVTGCSWQKNGEVTLDELTSDPVRYNVEEITIDGFYFQGFDVQAITERLEYSGYTLGHIVPKGEIIWVEGGILGDIHEELYIQDMMGPKEWYGKVRITGKFEYGEQYGHLGAYDFQILPSEVEMLEWSRPEL